MSQLRITTEGDSVTIDVEKGTEHYDPDTGLLFERWTGTQKEVEAAIKQADVDERDRAKNTKAAAAAAKKAADAEAKRVASADV